MTALAVSVGGMCDCRHTDRRHDVEGLCTVDGCECVGLSIGEGETALLIEPAPAPVIVERKGTIDATLAEGRKSPFKRTAALAEKIDGLIEDLRARLDAESVDAQAMREIAELEARLAAAKAKLRGGKPTAPATPSAKRAGSAGPVYGTYPCPDCDKVSTTAAGLSAHRRFNHPAQSEDGAA